MPNKGYRAVIEFIAFNDEPLDMDITSIRDYISVITASVAFGKSQDEIAHAVKRLRAKHSRT